MNTKDNIECTESLLEFIRNSPTAFQAVDEISKRLEASHFIKLNEAEHWSLDPGKYYLTKNGSSIIAFVIPESDAKSFMVAASHSDSPMFRLKPRSETEAFGKDIKLNVEGYGGMIISSWVDRPLSIAGRAVYRDGTAIRTKSVNVDRDLMVIPNVAIHFNREINNGYKYNTAVDMMPLFGSIESKGWLSKIISDCAGVDESNLLSYDMFLYNRTPGTIWGAQNEFFSSPRIDNLQCAYSTLEGFINASLRENLKSVPVYVCFDNEETGSATKQGAASTFLRDTLTRICEGLGSDLYTMLPSSLMLSTDNGHAKHPNHPELSDQINSPDMNKGVVIKYNASQKYATDAVSSALFSEICKNAGVPVQYMANRSDIPGGGTLGSISNTKFSLNTVDIGLAQIAMHSCYETAGTYDTGYMIEASQKFFESRINICDNGYYLG